MQPSPKNIIVKMPNWIGDLVMAVPVLEDLRHRYPQADITAMCQSNVAPLLEADPHITALYSYRRPSGWIRGEDHRKIIESLVRGEYDLGILLTHSFSSAWWFWRGKVGRRIGYGGRFRNVLLTDVVSPFSDGERRHQIEQYKRILFPLGISPSHTMPHLYLTDREREEAREKLRAFLPNGNAIVLGINPGATYGSAKCWLAERFVDVSKAMLEHKSLSILYFGDQSGSPLVDSICKRIDSHRVVNLAGKTSLRELVAFIGCCSLFLTNDSGPMHIASALGIPLVALFGSTDDKITGPYRGECVIHKHVECSPCYKRICPIDFRCMKNIVSEEVIFALMQIVNRLQP